MPYEGPPSVSATPAPSHYLLYAVMSAICTSYNTSHHLYSFGEFTSMCSGPEEIANQLLFSVPLFVTCFEALLCVVDDMKGDVR